MAGRKSSTEVRPSNAVECEHRPNPTDARVPSSAVRSPPPSQVPRQMPSSIGHSRRTSGTSTGPVACQTLVRSDGTTRSDSGLRRRHHDREAAPSRRSAGRDRITPLTKPAEHECREWRRRKRKSPCAAFSRRLAHLAFGCRERRLRRERRTAPDWVRPRSMSSASAQAAAAFRAATIWSAVRPVSSAM